MESKLLVVIILAALFLITPTPVIDSVSPNYGLNNGKVEMTIEGMKFDDKATVKMVKPGKADLTAVNVKVISKEKISCSFDLRGQTVGKWNVIVENPSKMAKKTKAGILAEGFTIQYPAPHINTIDPNTGLSSENLTLNLIGANFRNKAVVELATQEGKIRASEVNVLSESQIAARFDLAGSAPGKYDLKVINDDGKTALLPGGFEILERQLAIPVVGRIEPAEGYNNCIILTKIHGANFDPGSLVIIKGADGREIPGFDIIVNNAREISCRFDLCEQPIGVYDVIVINSDGREALLSAGFNIKEFNAADQILKDLTKPIFFDFDKSEIRPDQIVILKGNLKWLTENPDSYILLGGHADERGPREYNLVLSKRRAVAIKEYLLEKGIDPSKVTVYAYGEDYPSKKGHDEESWTYNRRVDLLVGEEPLTKEDKINGAP